MQYRRSTPAVVRFLSLLLAIVAGAMIAAGATADEREGDERATGTAKNLVKTMHGTADIMIIVGERYKNLYWAARLKKWEFAAYQAEEIESLIRKLKITKPKRAATAEEFLGKNFPRIIKAAESRNWRRFSSAFNKMRQDCMSCHRKNDHAFITLPIPKTASSPALNLR